MDPTLRLYAVLRADLDMPTGKAAAMAGHAFLDAFLDAPASLQDQYTADGHGTKVVLVAPDVATIVDIHDRAAALGLPYAIVIDSGHILPPHFDGDEITVGVGIGPATRDQMEALTGGLKCL